MASRPWSAAELELIEQHAETNNWSAVLSEIHDRTVNAVKVKMAKFRSASGYADARGGGDDWAAYQAAAVIASRQLAEATLRVGVWS